ncbi:cyclic pyranopterin phosphate synthase [Anaerosolibacter carboniphilus]|uniref:GTP 3',8-cyclase n=1 Tax=Anaerosolibacter carboniphilus TaxID=1417629 RepID=A0A841KY16_9FIRM|nr:GTP 3',8-cyclase MoaA [Anaerosolibacter carboniphilus]MBB6215812.1 cyclic pyranopterin phosphate synthase [Anaerosolibacter carboniphilus]
MKDTSGRNINYLRISITDLCNLRCMYCMPQDGIEKKHHKEILSLEEIYQVAKVAVDLGIHKIRITGGEPLVRKGIIKFIESIAQLDGVKDLAMTTNGLLLKKYAMDLKNAGINRVNISLDTLKAEKYEQITRGGKLKTVLEGIEEAKKVGLNPIKINTVLIGDFNDDEVENFVELTLKENIEVRFIELMPIGQASTWARNRFVSNNSIKERISELIPIYDGDKHSPAKYYKLPGGKGKVGFINPISSHFCKYCNRIRLTADGRLKPCLHSNQEIDIKTALRHHIGDLRKLMEEAILSKPSQHTLNDLNHEPIDRDMYRIGG